MKKEVVVLLVFLILIASPVVFAQEQTYSSFSRFVDNVKLFFSGGDNKVNLALEIREKEVNSALANVENGDEDGADKNLEKAWEKLQLIQERVSVNNAERVKESSDSLRNTVSSEKDLSEDFDVYLLEEEKTGLTAEWVIEKSGEEGQNLSWEVVGNMTGDQGRIVEIEKRINEIDGEINEWVVEHTYAEGTGPGGESGVVVEGDLANVVRTEVANGDNGLKWEVKTSVAKNEMVQQEVRNEERSETTSRDIATNYIDEGGDHTIDNSGDCGDGVSCGGDVDGVDPGPDGIVGYQGDDTHNADGTIREEHESHDEEDSGSASGSEESSEDSGSDDSSSSDSGGSSESSSESSSDSGGDSSVTGEAVKEMETKDNIILRFFKRLFG